MRKRQAKLTREPYRTNNRHPASRCSDGGRLPPGVGGNLPWSTWQASRGLSGRNRVDWVTGFMWTEWQPSHGLGGRHPWNTHRGADVMIEAKLSTQKLRA